MRLCSACLLGIACRYDGLSKPNEKIVALSKTETLIPVCPEQLGGQATPRPGSEITKYGTVVEESGNDVTKEFNKGASETLKIAKLLGVKEAIMKQRSPSCGSGQIYDGTFSKTIVKGDGIATALLKKNGIKVVSEEDI